MDGRAIWPALRASFNGAAIIALLLLAPAGIVSGGMWFWPRAVAFVAAYAAINAFGNLALAVRRPAHFQVRQQGVVAGRGKRQPIVDALGSVILLILGATWVVFIPIDVFRLHVFPPPSPMVSIAGLIAAFSGAALTFLAVWENRFTTPNVQQQDDQTIVSSGIYSLIRHPIYLGYLLLTVGAPLWLGSYAALWSAVVYLAATLGRISIEERDLRARLPQYAHYARRVRARLIPFVV